jgi:hypothetical protein
VLAVYVEARRRLLFERFREFWEEQERAGIWERLDRAADRTLEHARARREAMERAERAARALAEAEQRGREAAERARHAAEELRVARQAAGRND